MSAYIDTCDDCGTCLSCGRRWCPNEEPSPGEGEGLCDRCWMADDPEGSPMTTPDPLRQLATDNGVDYWTVITRPRLWAKADAVHDLMATVRAGAVAAQGKPLRDRRGRFVGVGK